MRWLRRLRARVKYRGFDADLKHELEVHRAMVEDELAAQGMNDAAARRRAARTLGNVTLERERARRVWMAASLESVWQDLRYAIRGLHRHPVHAFTTLAVLVVGIGLNTTVFSVANVLLLRQWSLPNPDALVRAFHVRPNGEAANLPFVEYRYMAERAQTLDLVAFREASDVILDGSEPGRGRLSAHFVSGQFFSTLGMSFALGRGLRPDDDRLGRPEPVAVVSHRFWQQRLGADARIIGRPVGLNGNRVIVVGVTTAGTVLSAGRGTPDVWLPFAMLPVLFPTDAFSRELLVTPSHCCVELAGRLRPGATRTAAAAELSALDRQFRASELPGDAPDDRGMLVTDTRDLNYPRGGAQQTVRVLGLLSAGVFLVLLLACANLGNLQLARSMARRPEIQVRLSIGASRGRIIRQLMTESLFLTSLAGALALAVASLLPGIVLGQTIPRAARELTFDPDVSLTMFTVVLAIVTAIASGLAPALRGTTAAAGGRVTGGGRVPLRAALLSVQVAISVALLVATVLMARGVLRASSSDPGFDVHGVSIVTIERRAPDDDSRQLFNTSLMDALDQEGISPVGMTAFIPFGNDRALTAVTRPGEPEAAARPVRIHRVSPGYFSVMQIPLRSGRVFAPAVAEEVVVNDTFAELLWPGGDAVGQRFNGYIVTGVVADAHIDSLGPVAPTFYEPIGGGTPNLIVRKDRILVDRIRAIVMGLDDDAIVTERAVSAGLDESLQGARIGAAIAGSLALIALTLASIGIAGVFSYVVLERTREIGVRRAVGADSWHIVQLISHRAGLPLVVGLASGLALSLLGGPVLSAFLFGLNPRDPATLLGAAAITGAAAVAAAAIPLIRAIRVDPAVTLRHE